MKTERIIEEPKGMSTEQTLYMNKNYELRFDQEEDPGAVRLSDIALLEAENRYHSFFENMEQGYYEIDLKGNFIFFNDFTCDIFGYSKDELRGMNYRQLMDEKAMEEASLAFADVLSTGKPRIGSVFQIQRKDGVKRQVGVSICVMKDINGNRAGFRGIARDISERKIVEAQKRQTQKLESIGRLASGIAHEINTPIQYTTDNTHFLLDSFTGIETILKGYHSLYETVKAGTSTDGALRDIETLTTELDLDYIREEIPKAIKQSLEGLSYVAGIVSAMKQFSHPGTEEKVYTDINKAIQNTITISRNEWKYVADMTTDFDLSLPLMPCLPSELNQVILNMIINAAHAVAESIDTSSGEKGVIKITTRRDDPWAEIRIADTGAGIPDAIRDRIFDPFFTTKEVGKGSGQGLSIAHSVIVSKHNGTITFESEINRGTTMIIRLPMSN